MSKKYTKYQKLEDFFQKSNSYPNTGDVEIDSSELVAVTNDRKEFEQIKLQKRQKKYLKDKIRKIGRSIDQRTVLHEAQRIPAYYDYDTMAYHELIGKALEIYVEETVTTNDEGKILNISSENKRVKEELNHLFFNVLNIHPNLPVWVYQTIKNGDCFLHLDVDDELGVVDTMELPAIEIERIESDFASRLHGSSGRLKDGETRFRWKGDSIIDFKYWTVAHFRLTMDQNFLPYGTSILEKCRRLWKNVVLAEDAMLAAYMIRGMDRLIYKIDVGNIDPDDVDAYLDSMADKFKRKIKVDPKTGQMDLKHNFLAIDQDLFIPVRNNNSATSVTKLEGSNQLNAEAYDKLMEKLVAALGIPLSYLNYKETAGEGKTLSMQDIRLARSVQRIQQCMIQELNKIAIIHLIAVGLEEELDSFYLSMNNPSIQKRMLEMELLAQQVSLYRDATDFSSGIAAMSMTNAKKKIFGWSEDEIKHDLLQQRLERAAIFELQKTENAIPNSGVFDDVDSLYGDPNADQESDEGGEAEDDFGGGIGGGGGGGSLGADLGGDELSLDDAEEGDELGLEGDDTDEGSDETEETVEETLFKNINNLLKG